MLECSCGLTHEDHTALPLVGYQETGDGGLLELRNCTCSSTRVTEVFEGAAATAKLVELAEAP